MADQQLLLPTLLTPAQATREPALRAFRARCVALAGPAMLPYGGDGYDPVGHGPLHGHCMGVAAAVQARWGGVVLVGWMALPGDAATAHYWNRLPDGDQIDLTSDQFGGDGYTPLLAAPPLLVLGEVGPWLHDEPHVQRFLAALAESEASHA